MKQKIIILICLLAMLPVTAQQLNRQLIGAAGNTMSNSTISIDFTVGDLAVTTIAGSDTIEQGFLAGTLPEECLVYKLPADNFKIQTSSETCTDKNNGVISINTTEVLDYKTEINGQSYDFTSSVIVTDLPPGAYPVCIWIADNPNCEQCFELTIEEAQVLTGKTTVQDKAVVVNIDSGTPPYTALVNDEIVEEYTSNSFVIELNEGDRLDVVSSLACEGKLSTQIPIFSGISLLPNPTQGDVTLTLPNTSVDAVAVEIHNALGMLMSTQDYSLVGGKAVLPTKYLAAGVYFVRVKGSETTFKVVKE